MWQLSVFQAGDHPCWLVNEALLMLVDTNNKQTNKQTKAPWSGRQPALFWSKDSLGGRKFYQRWCQQGIPLPPSFQQAEEETGLWLAAAGSLLMMSLNMEASCWVINWKNLWDGCRFHVDADQLLSDHENCSFSSQNLPGYHLLTGVYSKEISEISSVFGSVSPRWPWASMFFPRVRSVEKCKVI